jgi:hypothetical protein
MAAPFANGYALLVAVDQNSVAKWALPVVIKDVEALEQTLTHSERCGYDKGKVRVTSGKNATRKGIIDGLLWLKSATDRDPNATAFVYYTGHGWRDIAARPADFYFVPYDANETALRPSLLAAREFAEIVQSLSPRRLMVVLDCCHAGGMDVKDAAWAATRGESVAIPPSLLISNDEALSAGESKGMHELATGKGRAVLSSSTDTQVSYIRKDGKMSVFTYHLIEALTGHAAPKSGATNVLVSDVMGHVQRCVPETAKSEHNAVQDPDSRTTGNFPIALIMGGKGLTPAEARPDPLEFANPATSPATSHRSDTYKVGNISGSQGVVIGRNNTTTLHIGSPPRKKRKKGRTSKT